MTIQPVTSADAAYQIGSASPNKGKAAASETPKKEQQQDSVQLSPQAQAALGGDQDHDGDSH